MITSDNKTDEDIKTRIVFGIRRFFCDIFKPKKMQKEGQWLYKMRVRPIIMQKDMGTKKLKGRQT